MTQEIVNCTSVLVVLSLKIKIFLADLSDNEIEMESHLVIFITCC